MGDDFLHEHGPSLFSYADQVQAFAELFASGEAGFQVAKERALRGELRFSPIRSICWRVYLGVLPSPEELRKAAAGAGNDAESESEGDGGGRSPEPPTLESLWSATLKRRRGEYEALKQAHMIDPHAQPASDLDIHNPLSQAEDSPWQQFFENQELQKEINQDIIRTYPDKEFFQRKETQELLLRILFIYAKEHPQVLYKQGMHELLAPIVYLLHKEQVTEADYRESDMVSLVNTEEFLEHDAYTLFLHVMQHTEEWYIYSNNKGSAPEDESIMSPVVVKCKKIQHILLKQKDPQLYAYLEDLNIEPQLYALRWIRLLFGREFHLDDVLVIWDALFAYGNDLALVDHICIAMLQYIRGQLLEMDYNMCLRRLFKYPPVEDVSIFVEKAMAIARPAPAAPAGSAASDAAPAASSSGSSGPGVSASSRDTAQAVPVEKRAGVTAAIKQLLEDPLERAVTELKKEVGELKETQLHMANRIERIVFILQDSLRTTSAAEADIEPTLLAIAELKQIKDILGGLLPPDTVPIIQPRE